MGNKIYCFCCQRKEDDSTEAKEADLTARESNNNTSNVLSQFYRTFNEKLPDIGSYSSITDVSMVLSDRTKEIVLENPFDTSKVSTANTRVYQTKPIRFKNGNIYEGNWNEEIQMEGYGKLFLKEDNVYVEGFWKKGVLNYGRICFPNGDVYEGMIDNSLFHGKGAMYYNDGSIYKGAFINGERNGYGVLTLSDGCRYQGEFFNDLFNGQGEFQWNNGYKYVGNFEDSMLSGIGMLTDSENKSTYEGEFYKNKFHGNGVFTFGKTGSVYKGRYEQGLKKGNGEFIKKDGTLYKGGFDGDRMHACGEIIRGNTTIKGCWRNGELVDNPILLINSIVTNKKIDKAQLDFEIEKEDLSTDSLKYIQKLDISTIQPRLSQSYIPVEHFTENLDE